MSGSLSSDVGYHTNLCSTCVLTILRVLAIFHESADFTWGNIPIAAYYVFEPVGGLFCINIPFIARAIRKKMKAKKINSGPERSLPYNKSVDSEKKRQRRQSHWLRGIDSIQLTGMSSRRRSMVGGVDVQQRPWIPITPNSSQFDLTPPNATGVNEVVISTPESSFYWDEILVGSRSTNSDQRSKHNSIPLEEAVVINRTRSLSPEPENRD